MNCLNCGQQITVEPEPDDWNTPVKAWCKGCYDGASEHAVARIIGRGQTETQALVDWAGQYAEATT